MLESKNRAGIGDGIKMAVKSKFPETNASSIQSLFTDDAQFVVPQFQRNYGWTKENIEMLWTDLMDNFLMYKNNKKSSQARGYLLGPIVLVYNNKENEYCVIDGQQRLATITMLFCVMRDLMIDNQINEHNESLYSEIVEMIKNSDRENNANWRLTLNDTDRELFRQIQYPEESGNSESKLRRIRKTMDGAKSHKLLVNNYQLLYESIEYAVCTGFNDRRDVTDEKKLKLSNKKESLIKKNIMSLHEFLTYFIQENFMVSIIANDDATAYQIFETLNYRGRQLSKSNLIKNHVLSKITKKGRHYWSDRWNTIFDEIIKQDEDDDVFIWESFRSRNHKNTTALKKNLYALVKKEISTEKEAKQYVRTLKRDASILTQMYNPNGYSKATKNDFYAIKALSAKNIRVPILAAYRKWHDKPKLKPNYIELVSFLVKYFFYMKVIRKRHASKIEKKMLEIVGLIEDDTSLQNIVENLQKDYEEDRFNQDFDTFINEPSDAGAKYFLRQVTVALGTKDSDVETVDSITLEHILPKNTNKWDEKVFLNGYKKPGKTMNDFINHLGNLTLLNEKINKKIQNSPFSDKRIAYFKSKLDINEKTVYNHTEWTAQIIEGRGRLLAKCANEIWNLKGRHHT